MAVRIIGNDYNGVLVDVSYDVWILHSDTLLTHTDNALDLGSLIGSTVQVDGSIVAGLDGIGSSSDSNSNNITVAQSGSVTGDSDGIEVLGNFNRVTNFGTVTGYGSSGIEILGTNAFISNFGTVRGANGIH